MAITGDIADPQGLGFHDGFVDRYDIAAMMHYWLADDPNDSNQVQCDLTGSNDPESPDGIVNLCDFSILSTNWAPPEILIPSNPPSQLRQLLIADAGTAVTRPTDFVAGEIPAAISPGYQDPNLHGGMLWGHSGRKIYSSDDGDTWNLRYTITGAPAVAVWSFPGGLVLWATGNQLYRGVWNGLTLEVTTNPILTDLSISFSSLATNAIRRAPHGTIIVAPYGPDSRKIWRSVDNAETLSIVYTHDAPRHWHGVGWHAGTSRWLVVRGDIAVNQQTVLYSDDDGLSWQTLPTHNPGARYYQDPALLDVGDPNRMLTGADSAGGLRWLDVLSGELIEINEPIDQYGDTSYVFSLLRYQGITYAPQTNWAPTNPATQTAIFASGDYVHWIPFAQPPYGANEVIAAGVDASGRIHFRLNGNLSGNTDGHLVVVPPTLRNINSLCYQPKYQNQLDSTDSDFEATGNLEWYVSSQFRIRQTLDAFQHGEQCLHSYSPTQSTSWDGPRSPIIPALPGKSYGARIWVRRVNENAIHPGTIYATLFAFKNSSWSRSLRWSAVQATTEWQEILVPPITLTPYEDGVQLLVTAFTDADRQVYIDCAGIYQTDESPAPSWQPASKSSDVSYSTVADANSWTNLIGLRPDTASYYWTGAGNLDVRSWTTGGVKIKLVYSTEDWRFKLLSKQRVIAASDVIHLAREVMTWLVLRVDDQNVSMAISAGRPWTIHNGSLEGPINGEITLQTGGFLTMPFDLGVDVFLPYALGDEELTPFVHDQVDSLPIVVP